MLLTIIYYVAGATQRNATMDGNATYDDAVFVIAAVEIDYNVAVLV